MNVNFGTGEQFRSTQYDVCYYKETLFTVYVIVKSYLDIDGFRSEIILDVRKCKEPPFSENITEEETSE